MGARVRIPDEDKAFIRRLLVEAKSALKVLSEKAHKEDLAEDEKYAVRYAVIQIVESLAIIASRLGDRLGRPVEGYVEAMRFLAEGGFVNASLKEELVRLARLRNLLVHRYWVIDDQRVISEARRGGVERIRRVLDELQGLAG